MIFLCIQIWAALVIVSIHGDSTDEKHFVKRIIGGDYAPPEKYPWAVSIRGDLHEYKVPAICGATLISDTWLLTAAHCIYPGEIDGVLIDLRDPSLWHITAGQVDVKLDYEKEDHSGKNQPSNELTEDLVAEGTEQGVVSDQKLYEHYHVQRIILHPDYTTGALDNDIALMKLEKPLPLHKMKGVAAINLPSIENPSEYPPIGQECVLVGWGCTVVEGHSTPKAKFANLEVVSKSNCIEMSENEFEFNDEIDFCAGYHNRNLGGCPGDSGGGLVCESEANNWTVAGVASAAHATKPGDLPAIFARVSFFTGWIKTIMEESQ